MSDVDTRGDNSGADDTELAELLDEGSDEQEESDRPAVTVGGVAGERLRSFIQRIERLEEEKKTIADDIREIFAEAKSNGFDPKVMRIILKRRKRDKADLEEEEMLLDTYLHALGMLD